MEKLNTGNKNRKPAGYNKRTEEQRDYDISFCSNLFLRGYTYREIVAALNDDLAKRKAGYTISLAMVYYDLQQTLIEWKRERLENIDEYVTQELRKLDAMEQQAWEAWEASKTGKQRTKEKTNKGRPIKTDAEDGYPEYYGYNETATETSAGNPRFLDLLLNIQQRRAKMLGFDAPVKIEIPGYNAGTDDDKPKYDVKAIPDDMLFALADKLQSAEFQRTVIEKGGAQ
mgnify:CR=1 FL=1